MKKLKEIPFNHELIGQEGIVIKTRGGKEILQTVYLDKLKNNYPIIAVVSEKTTNIYTIKGRSDASSFSEYDLIMYKEIEVKEPRVIWVNIYESGTYGAHPTAEVAANCATKGRKHETVKFIEVIEEGE